MRLAEFLDCAAQIRLVLRDAPSSPMMTPNTICATSGVWVRGEMRARKGGSSQSRLATMTMRDTEKRPTVRAVTMPISAAKDTMYCIGLRPAFVEGKQEDY